jgi:DNA-binding NarL/FixJ family response regulator
VSGERTESADRIAGLLVGGDDYMVKPFDPDELMARVRRLIEKAAAMRRPSSSPGIADLTSREIEVLRLLAEGLDQRAIAARLVISPTTVATHIQRILTKLDVRSRTHAVAPAYCEHLLEPA